MVWERVGLADSEQGQCEGLVWGLRKKLKSREYQIVFVRRISSLLEIAKMSFLSAHFKFQSAAGRRIVGPL